MTPATAPDAPTTGIVELAWVAMWARAAAMPDTR